MKRTTAFRITADLCFYFCVLSIFPALRPWQLPMLLFTAAAFLVTLLAVYCPYALLRFLLSLLPGLCFLLAPVKFPLFFPGLAWLYLILVLSFGRFGMFLDDYRRIYRIMLIVCLCSLAANIAHSAVYRGDVISYYSIGYALAFLFFGMLAMREMQMNAKMGLSWRLMNAATVIGVPALAIGASVLLFYILRTIEPVVSYLFRPIGTFLMMLFSRLFPGSYEDALPTPKPSATPLPTPAIFENPASEGQSVLEENINADFLRPETLDKAAQIGGYAVLVALVLLAVYVVFRYARMSRVVSETDEYLYEESEEALPKRKRRTARTAPVSGNAQQIRRIYKKYLELMRENGVRIQKDSTSREILEEAELVNLSPSAARLRELYLKARYGEDGAVSREDVQEAQRCLQEIREQEGWKR